MRLEFVPERSKLAPLLIFALWSCLAFGQTSVPKWSLYEADLTASGNAKNWYTDPHGSVTVTFSGPGGMTKSVTGFWDGGNSFKVRFTPTVEGRWTYRTSSSDAGLNGKSGQLTCVAPLAGKHGFLRIDANHPYSFVWDDGSRYFMWGQTYYDVLQPALVNDNWKASVDKSLEYGMNKVRMHVYAQNFYLPNVEFTKYPDAQPYLGSSTDPERDHLNIPYWRKLDEIVQYMDAKGMVADLIITNPYWDNRQFGTDQQNDRFVRYVVSRYAAYANVIWCLANEWGWSATGNQYKGAHRQNRADFERMGTLVRKNDVWIAEGAFLRLLSIHSGTSINFELSGSTWPTYAILQYGGWNPDYMNGDEWGNA